MRRVRWWRLILLVLLGGLVIFAWEIDACSIPAGLGLLALAIFCIVAGD